MPILVLDLLRYAFLILLYIFVARVVKVVYLEMRPPTAVPRRQRQAAPAPGRPPSKRSKKTPRKVAVIEGGKLKGKSFELSDELIMGRSDKCALELDDSYASQVHARIFARDNGFMLEDLGSTNGTYLNRRKVTTPVELQRGDRIKIGKTVLELRK